MKITPWRIKFSTKQTGISYLIDEAGVRTCFESFTPLKKVSKEMWERNTALWTRDAATRNFKGTGIPLGLKGQITWHKISQNEPIM